MRFLARYFLIDLFPGFAAINMLAILTLPVRPE